MITEGLLASASQSTPEREYRSLMPSQPVPQGILGSDQSFNQGLAYRQPVQDAIRSKYTQEYNTKMSGLENQTKLDARNAYFNRLSIATDAATKEAQLNFQKESMKYKMKMAKRAQRMQAIGAILGVGGTVVGAMVGGPAGAVAGSQTGTLATKGAE